MIRGSGALERASQIENVFLKSIGGTPIYLRDVATVVGEFRAAKGL